MGNCGGRKISEPTTIPTYTADKVKSGVKKFLCPTRFLFSSFNYHFVWNDEGKFIESEFEFTSPVDYIKNIGSIDEYPFQFILTWILGCSGEEKYASFFPLKSSIKNLDKHPYAHCLNPEKEKDRDHHKQLFSYDKNFEFHQGYWYQNVPKFLVNNKTGQKTKIEDGLEVYSLKGNPYDENETVMIAKEYECFVARKITSSGTLLPAHSSVKMYTKYHYIASLLYDSRFVVTGRGHYQNPHDLFVCFWSLNGENYSFFVKGPFINNVASCWQLPSLAIDVSECRRVLEKWTTLPTVIITLIITYACPSTSDLDRMNHPDFNGGIVSKIKIQ